MKVADESYTKIPNNLLSALAVYKFNGRQRAIIDVICRYTFGYNRAFYKFPVALFEAITGIKRNNVSAEITKLVNSKIVNVVGNPSKTETRLYSINMNFQQWGVEKRETNTTTQNNTTTIKSNTIENDTNLVSKPIVDYYQIQDKTTIENDTHIIKSFNNNINNKNINSIVDTADALPTTPKFTDESFEVLCVNTIIKSCLELYPNSKVPSTYAEKEKWAIEIDRMKRLDSRTEEEIKQALYFAINDNFWKQNIRSAKKLREKFETLIIQSKQKKGNGKKQTTEEFFDLGREWLSERTGISSDIIDY